MPSETKPAVRMDGGTAIVRLAIDSPLRRQRLHLYLRGPLRAFARSSLAGAHGFDALQQLHRSTVLLGQHGVRHVNLAACRLRVAQQNHGHMGRDLFEPLHQLVPAHLRQVHLRQHQVHLHRAEGPDRLLTRGRGDHLVSVRCERELENRKLMFVSIDAKDDFLRAHDTGLGSLPLFVDALPPLPRAAVLAPLAKAGAKKNRNAILATEHEQPPPRAGSWPWIAARAWRFGVSEARSCPEPALVRDQDFSGRDAGDNR